MNVQNWYKTDTLFPSSTVDKEEGEEEKEERDEDEEEEERDEEERVTGREREIDTLLKDGLQNGMRPRTA